jgi:hypothetical protein
MEKLYDKLILLAVLIALLITGFLTLTQYNGLKALDLDLPTFSQMNDYENVVVDQNIADPEEWKEPKMQRDIPDEFWKYSVFTPPKIYIDDDGELIAKEPGVLVTPPPEKVIPPFGVVFTDISREKFRYQYSSFSGTVDKAKISIINTDDSTDVVSGRIGETNREAKIKFLSFTEKKEEIINEKGLRLVRVARLRVRDLESGKEFTLTNQIGEEKVYTGTLNITITSQLDPAVNEIIQLNRFDSNSSPFKTFKVFNFEENFTYKLTEVYFDDKKVLISKTNKEDGTSIEMLLEKEVLYDLEGNILEEVSEDSPEDSTQDPFLLN